ncbi:MAG: glycosyltransferase family 2 protein [Bacteroidota bacterium]
MDSLPLVSIICLCYNQKDYVKAALISALSQSYPNIEIIVIDDASTDGSQSVIQTFVSEHPGINFLPLEQNIGNCRAFNLGFKLSKGKYIIDLAADDELLPVRVEIGIKDFESNDRKFGVHFSDAFIMDQEGKMLDTHYARNRAGEIIEEIPQGDIYKVLIKRYFINPPTMMVRREVLEELGGYDEDLTYEDFDFWIRSARKYEYLFNKAPLVKKRIVKKSLSAQQFKFYNKHQASTLKVCHKILELNQSKAENKALVSRCWYEIRQCIKTLNLGLIPKYIRLLLKVIGTKGS